MKLFEYETIDSTFVRSGRMAPGLDKGQYLFLAECQTEGRGQEDHRFESPDGNGIYGTLLVRYPDISAERLRLLTPMAAVCITDRVKEFTDFGDLLSVRFVNDLMLDGKKYGGILSGACVDGKKVSYVRIGFGINTGNDDISRMIGKPAESLHIGNKEKRHELALSCAESMSEAISSWDEEKIFSDYSSICRMRGVKLVLPDGRLCRAEDLNPDFSLNVKADDGTLLTLNSTTGIIFI